MTISGASPVVITGNFVNTSSGAWTNNGDLTITGNITNDQAGLTPGTGITRLAGTAVQTIAGGQPFVTNNLTLTNSAGYTLNQSLQVAGAATFTNGIVTATTSSTPMIFGSPARRGIQPYPGCFPRFNHFYIGSESSASKRRQLAR